MNPLQKQGFICGTGEIAGFQSREISHWICIANPGAQASKPSWFAGSCLQLFFGDVFSEKDAAGCKTRAPSASDIQKALDFFRTALRRSDSKVLVACDYGTSRSPALAYLCIADQLGPGRELEAFNFMLEIRPVAVPNGLIVRLGDKILKRDGALLQPLKEFNSRLSAELFNTTTSPRRSPN